MKTLKTLLSLAIAMSITTPALAETTNPFKQVKQTSQTTVQTVQQQTANVKNAMTEKVTETAKSASDKANSSKSTAKEILASAKKSAKETASKANEKVAKASKININTANLKALQELDGIGETKAQAILKYRKKVGTIKNAEELLNVDGIGKATLDKITPFLSFY